MGMTRHTTPPTPTHASYTLYKIPYQITGERRARQALSQICMRCIASVYLVRQRAGQKKHAAQLHKELVAILTI